MLRGLLVTVLLGCGRIGFDAVGAGDDDLPAAAPWQLVQTADAEPDARMAMVRVRPLGAGNLVVVAVEIDDATSAVNAVMDSSGCNTYVAVPAAAARNDDVEENVQLYYAKKSCAGAVSVTAQAAGVISGIAVWEVAGIRTDAPLDGAAALDNQPRNTRVLGPRITTTASGDFVVAVALGEFFVTGTHAGDEFVNDLEADGNGWAHLRDPQAPAGEYQAEWDELPGGAYCASAVAFRAGT